MRFARLVWLVGFAAACQLAAGCARSWPSVRGVAAERFAAGARAVRSVDILPIDVQLWTYRGNARSPRTLDAGFVADARAEVAGALAGRGYQVRARIGWDGRYVAPDGKVALAMAPQDVARTAYALSGYGVAQARYGSRRLLVPYLPVRLGTRTGAGATLYVGGWAYVGKDGSSTATKILEGVAIATVALVIVAAVIAGIKGGGGGGGGGAAAGHAAAGVARVVGRTAGGAAHVACGFGRAVLALGRTAGQLALTAGRITFAALDAFGRSATSINIYAGRPDYYDERSTPSTGKSQMLLDMTLIDNATGTTLWHARQRFRASAARRADVREVVRHMLASLPPAR